MNYVLLSIIKNEHFYLDEWIRYHLNLGIQRIIIFEDLGSKSHKDICDKYEAVTLKSIRLFTISSTQKINQISAFKITTDYIKRNFNPDWLFYIDTDEFITLCDEYPTLDSVFSLFTEYPGVRIQSQNFNANGHIYRQPSVLEAYTEKCAIISGKIPNRVACKCAINMKKYVCGSDTIVTHHILKDYIKTNFDYDLDSLCYDKIYIRHYITKSFEDWVYKICVRGQFFGSKKFDDFFTVNPTMDKEKLTPLIEQFIQKFSSQSESV